jgi:hypothetical protein
MRDFAALKAAHDDDVAQLGHHDPTRVRREDYSPDTFVPGPPMGAMRTGRFERRLGAPAGLPMTQD